VVDVGLFGVAVGDLPVLQIGLFTHDSLSTFYLQKFIYEGGAEGIRIPDLRRAKVAP
jgi:hypothetical protein